jgi:hypothetical protein
VKPLSIDAVELGDAAEDLARIRAERAAAAEIRTAGQRLEAWAHACSNGSSNVLTVAGVCYSWDAHPRKLQNGALQGRVYAQPRGESPRDIGGFKIDARGRVLQVPRELAGVLPGTDASTSDLDSPTTTGAQS